MTGSRYQKQVMVANVICFVLPAIFQVLSVTLYPPDFSGEFPVYLPEGILLLQFAGAFLMMGYAIIGMKAEEEKQTLAAAGFTAQAIAIGVGMAGLFEITKVASSESYEKFYYITVSSNFLFFPSLLLIATYNRFKKWIRIAGFISSLPLLISTILFVARYRNYNVLESISNTGYSLLMIVWLLWGINIYINYRNELKSQTN